jgi:hypothetical protein
MKTDVVLETMTLDKKHTHPLVTEVPHNAKTVTIKQ